MGACSSWSRYKYYSSFQFLLANRHCLLWISALCSVRRLQSFQDSCTSTLCTRNLQFNSLLPFVGMSRRADLLCTELSVNPAMSTKLLEDQRRLRTLLEQEGRFIPCRGTINEDLWTNMLLSIYEAVCSPLNSSDVFHLAVNLMDRYLSQVQLNSEADYRATAVACTMISLKIRRARRECLNYDHLKIHFSGTSEKNIRLTEKKIAAHLKWDLNAVTVADFIYELSERLCPVLNSFEQAKLVEHSLTLANVCLIYLGIVFASMPPSLLACACISDAVRHLGSEKYSKCVDMLSELANIDRDVLLQHQHRVGDLFNQKLTDQSADAPEEQNVSTSELEAPEYTLQDYDSYPNPSLMEALS